MVRDVKINYFTEKPNAANISENHFVEYAFDKKIPGAKISSFDQNYNGILYWDITLYFQEVWNFSYSTVIK